MAYLLPIIVSIICIIVYDLRHSERFGKVMFWGICIYLTVMFGIRVDIGYDTIHLYQRFYQTFPTFSTPDLSSVLDGYSEFAAGFQFMMLLYKSLGLPWWTLQLTIAAIINFSIFYFVGRRLEFRFLAILLYMVCFAMLINVEIIRQSLALSIFLLSYPLLLKRQWGYFLITTLVATQFHTSAFMLLLVPLAYLLKIDLNKRLVLAFVAMSVIVYLTYLCLADVSKIFGPTYSRKIIYYAFTLRYEHNVNYYIYHCLCLSLIPLAVSCYYKYGCRRVVPFSHMVSILPLLLPGIIAFGAGFLRLGYYFLPFFIFSAANLIGHQLMQRELKNRLCALGLGIAMMILYSYEVVKTTAISDQYYPYKSIITHTAQPR